MGKTLTLSLKKKWFDMIASGEKKEEYRELTLYWQKRLLRCGFVCNGNCVLAGEVVCPACRYLEYANYDAVTFTLGYPRADDTSRRMTFAVEDICFGEGKPEWGAEEETQYFVIKFGERLC